MYYVGMDIHKNTIVFWVLAIDGRCVAYGVIGTSRDAVEAWAKQLPTPWTGVMEATLFTQHIYHKLLPYAHELQVGHSEKMREMNPDKHKTDFRDARFFAKLGRGDLVPRVHAFEPELYALRQVLRYRNGLLVQAVRMHNKTASLLMESGTEYDKRRLHGKKYFAEIIEHLGDVPEIVVGLLQHSQSCADLFSRAQKRLLATLSTHAGIRDRVARLRTIRGVGVVTALTWALEIGDPSRFSSIADAISYSGLCAAEHQSAGKRSRGRLSPRCNKHLRTVLIEAAKLAPRHNQELARLYSRELERTKSENLATIAVARKMVTWLMAIDKREEDFTEQRR